MRDKLFGFGSAVWAYANTNVGSILIGAMVSHILTKGAREDELIDTKYKLDKAEEKLSKVENKLQESEVNVSRLMQSGIDTKFNLQDCLRTKDNLSNLYSNSFCIFRYPGGDEKYKNIKHENNHVSLPGGK